jgi:RNA polymerase sigma-70 factor (ECF subfamily)
MTDDKLTNELRQLDPVKPGSLDGAAESDAAARLMARILAEDPAAGAEPAVARHRWWRPTPVRLALVGTAVAAVVVAVIAIGSSGGGGSGGARPDRLAGALDRAAAVAAAQPPVGVEQPYSYLKTRELAVDTTVADRRSWHISQVTIREEWMTPDGPGQMRIVAGPSHFVGASDRAEWESAGRPGFLALGFGRRTEVHWIAGNVMRRRVEDLPTDPAALSVRLRHEAQAEAGELPLPAATLQLIAEDLRSPAASPRLRAALYEAAKLVPGIRSFGARTDAEGRRGFAIGVSGLGPDGKAQFALIFDPETSRPLATEEIAPTGAGAGPTIRRVTTYLEAPQVAPPGEGGTTL